MKLAYLSGGTFDPQGRAHHGWRATLILALRWRIKPSTTRSTLDLPSNEFETNSTSLLGSVVEDLPSTRGIYGFPRRTAVGYFLSLLRR